MAFTTTVSSRGGEKLQATLAKAEQSRRKSVKVGFFSTAKYQDGTLVAGVAAGNEFGIQEQGIPERPFFRQSIAIMNDELPDVVKRFIDPTAMELDNRGANIVGAYAADVIQQRIVDLKEPPNSPITIALKGSSNPLVDTGHMRQSVTWEVE